AEYLWSDTQAKFFDARPIFVVSGLNRLPVPLPKIVERSQQPGLDKIEEAPKIRKCILHRCASARDLETHVLFLRCSGHHGSRILDTLCFVAYHDRPRLESKREFQIAQCFVSR